MNMRDMDEVEAEQLERRQRKELTAKFKNFIKQVCMYGTYCIDVLTASIQTEEASKEEVEFDTPFYELSFNGMNVFTDINQRA